MFQRKQKTSSFVSPRLFLEKSLSTPHSYIICEWTLFFAKVSSSSSGRPVDQSLPDTKSGQPQGGRKRGNGVQLLRLVREDTQEEILLQVSITSIQPQYLHPGPGLKGRKAPSIPEYSILDYIRTPTFLWVFRNIPHLMLLYFMNMPHWINPRLSRRPLI